MNAGSSGRVEGWFPATSWTLLNAAGGGSEDARSKLFETYWKPVCAFIRQHGFGLQDSEDLAQSFFAKALETNWFGVADRNRGRFRSFLLASVRNFVLVEHQKQVAAKRGGGMVEDSLESIAIGEQPRANPEDQPAAAFDRHYALGILEAALTSLQTEYAKRGKADLFDSLKPFLIEAQPRGVYRALGDGEAGDSSQRRVAVHRLRSRFRALVRAEIAGTVETEEEIDEEIQYLLNALGNGRAIVR